MALASGAGDGRGAKVAAGIYIGRGGGVRGQESRDCLEVTVVSGPNQRSIGVGGGGGVRLVGEKRLTQSIDIARGGGGAQRVTLGYCGGFLFCTSREVVAAG